MAVRIPSTVAAPRARAAIGWAGLSRNLKELSTRTGISPATLNRIVSSTDQRGAERDELLAIARACGVPDSFIDVGFAPLERPISEVEQRVIELEQRLDDYAAERQELLAELATLVGQEVARALETGQLPTAGADQPTSTQSRSSSAGQASRP